MVWRFFLSLNPSSKFLCVLDPVERVNRKKQGSFRVKGEKRGSKERKKKVEKEKGLNKAR
jgi:hypothetical protein